MQEKIKGKGICWSRRKQVLDDFNRKEYTVNSNKKIYTSLCGEVALVESTDLSQDRLRTSTWNTYPFSSIRLAILKRLSDENLVNKNKDI
jgi:hypothetical protein